MNLFSRKLTVLTALLLPHLSNAGLIGHWQFDEASGIEAVDSVSANNGSWVRGVNFFPNWQPTGGLIGGAMRFPGTGTHQNYFSIDGFPELNGTPDGFSVSVWLKPQGASGYRGILMSRTVSDNVSGGGTSQNYGIGHDSDHIDSRVSGQELNSVAGSLPASSDWVHIVWVWDNVSGTQQIYRNGVQSGSTGSGDGYPTGLQISSNGEWRIGDDACCSNRNFNGFMDDLSVWDEPLSTAAISGLYQNGLLGFTAAKQAPPTVTEPLNVGLVINEVHYDADPKTQAVEFIELLNTNDTPLDLSGVNFSDGVEWTCPAGTILPATSYLLVAEDPTAFRAIFPAISAETQIFAYTGSLSGDGEEIDLRAASGVRIDRVKYQPEFPWPISANGEGASMQLINATLDNDLGGAWRGSFPSPGGANLVFSENAPPLMRQVDHLPKNPSSSESITVTVKATDPDGIASLALAYQVVEPGQFLPAFLPLSSGTLRSNPTQAKEANPAFEAPANWTTIIMRDDGIGGDATAGDTLFTAVIPAQAHRSLVRYRITATDTPGASVRVPYADDSSLNFALFVYDGIPDYTANLDSVHPDGPGHTYPSTQLDTLPTYHLITDAAHLRQCWAYNSSDQVSGVESRKTFNWEGAMVFEGKVYDHIGYRLRQKNDRYIGQGRRSMRFRFRKGNYLAARDPFGDRYPHKWRSMNTSKMSRFAEQANHGMRELVSSRLWNLAGVTAPEFQHVHFRVIDDAAEYIDQYNGDFYGLSMIFEDVDATFLKNRELPRGNVYKLKDGATSPLELQKFQSRTGVTDASDFINIRDNLGPPDQSDQWLRDHVDWSRYYLYAALGEGFRHYDFSPAFQKNRIWYFRPDPLNPLGKMSIIPHDTDATWKRGTNDNEWNDPMYSGGVQNGVPYRGRVVGIDLPKEAIQEITGLSGVDGENHPEREAFMLEYRNTIREVSDIFWKPETVNTTIDDAYQQISSFSLADRDRWDAGPAITGNENIGALEPQIAIIKSLAFVEDLYMGVSTPGGRTQRLIDLAADSAIPATPSLTYTGPVDFPAGALAFQSSAYSDPQGAITFSTMEWRVAEVAPAGAADFIESGHTWKYFDNGTDPGSNWAAVGFDDSAWESGPSELGYGEGDEATTLAFIDTEPLTPGVQKNAAVFLRTSIEVPDPLVFDRFLIEVKRDDGIIVHINGQEVYRDSIPSDVSPHLAYADDTIGNEAEALYIPIILAADSFQAGSNTIAVSLHQTSSGSSDLSFDFRLSGSQSVASRPFEWKADWEQLTPLNQITVPAVATRVGSTYRARVRHQDNTGRWSHWSEPLEFVVGEPEITPFLESLVISEVMYRPAAPSTAELEAGFLEDNDFEFIELRNVGSETLDLSGVRFTKGIDFDFAGSSVTTLAPGAFVLVVEDQNAFTFRYGAGLPIAGEWSGGLSANGERIKLSFGAGETIREFTYGIVSPWPVTTAGQSIALVHPFAAPDHAEPYSWRTSVATGGSVASSDGTTFTGSGEAAFLEYATGSKPPEFAGFADGSIVFTIELNQLADDLAGELVFSTDLEDWNSAPFIITSRTPTTPGFARLTFTGPIPSDAPQVFFRYEMVKK